MAATLTHEHTPTRGRTSADDQVIAAVETGSSSE